MPAAPLVMFLIFIGAIVLVPSQESRVILLPDADGQVGIVEVQTKAGQVLMDQAGQMVRVTTAAQPPEEPVKLNLEKIEKDFAEILAAEPPQPKKFLLYFQAGGSQLAEQSKALIPAILTEIYNRKSSAIGIYGHSDRVGSKAFNLKLSLERAQAIRSLLEEGGVRPESMDIDSHGEGNPLIPTADNIAEPRNRRVEVVVR